MHGFNDAFGSSPPEGEGPEQFPRELVEEFRVVKEACDDGIIVQDRFLDFEGGLESRHRRFGFNDSSEHTFLSPRHLPLAKVVVSEPCPGSIENGQDRDGALLLRGGVTPFFGDKGDRGLGKPFWPLT